MFTTTTSASTQNKVDFSCQIETKLKPNLSSSTRLWNDLPEEVFHQATLNSSAQIKNFLNDFLESSSSLLPVDSTRKTVHFTFQISGNLENKPLNGSFTNLKAFFDFITANTILTSQEVIQTINDFKLANIEPALIPFTGTSFRLSNANKKN